jgi:hypothetical protein
MEKKCVTAACKAWKLQSKRSWRKLKEQRSSTQ